MASVFFCSPVFFLTLSLLAVTSAACCLTFAISLDPDQDRQNVVPDLDLNHFTLDCVPEGFFFKLR